MAARSQTAQAGHVAGGGAMIVWRWIRGIVLFLVDYVVGDWTVAALIGVGLLVTWRLVESGVAAWWLLPLVVLAANIQSLWRAVRSGR
jgi:hypothetical protein